ncbi:MAG TPA: glycosyltransferase family 4 protein [Acidimicrobiales bacterium]|nr:glycosyltransferase family 4 protein [Acidimicrobiales bacterium]
MALLGSSGAAVHIRHVAAALERRGHVITIACARLGNGNPPPDVESVIELPRADDEELRDLLARTAADAVIESYCLESGPGRRATAAVGIPLILEVGAPLLSGTRRCCGFLELAQPLTAQRWLFGTSDHVTVVSRALADYVRRSSPDVKVSLVPNGVDAPRFAGAVPDDLGLPPDALVVGYVGNPKPGHGLGDLIQAFAHVAVRHRRAHLVIVGSCPEGDSLARSLELTDRVHLLGTLPHARVPDVVARFDVAVAPYRQSASFYFCPIKLFEYIAAARPVVHPGLGDIPELVGLSGVSYPAGDVTRLARALEALLDDPGRRTAISARSRRRGVPWSWDDTASSLESLAFGPSVAFTSP